MHAPRERMCALVRHNSPTRSEFHVTRAECSVYAGVLFYCSLTCINLEGAARETRVPTFHQPSAHFSPFLRAHTQYSRKDYDMKNSSTGTDGIHPLRGEAAVNIEFHLRVIAACGCLRVHVASLSLRPEWLAESVLFEELPCGGMRSHISYIVFALFRSPREPRLSDAFACRVTSRARLLQLALVTLSNWATLGHSQPYCGSKVTPTCAAGWKIHRVEANR